MLTKIRSSYIIQKLFLNIFYDRKLNLFVYNKKMQNILDINITDYMRLSGKKVIGDRNGYGREYDIYNNKLIFEGEYLNGKRNGKGKEYDYYNRITFEGEYLNGKRNGKGKEYDDSYFISSNYLYKNKNEKEIEYSGKLKYEGQFLNGKRNGKGKEYDENYDIISFEGEYFNGKKWNGKGNEVTHHDGKLYFFEVEYFEGMKTNCKGVERYTEDIMSFKTIFVYDGEYLNEERHGKGKEYYHEDGILKFEGEYVHNQRRRGKKYYKNGIIKYEGDYLLIENGMEKDMTIKEI